MKSSDRNKLIDCIIEDASQYILSKGGGVAGFSEVVNRVISSKSRRMKMSLLMDWIEWIEGMDEVKASEIRDRLKNVLED